MRIGIVTDSIEWGPVSVGNYTKNLVENLVEIAKEDTEFVLIHCQKGNDPIYEKAEEIVLPFPVKKASHSFFPLRLLSFAKRQISEFAYNYQLQSRILNAGIDVVHIPHLGRPAPSYFLLFFKSKYIVTNHGMANLALSPKLCYRRKTSLQLLLDYKNFLKWKYLFRNKFVLMITVSESEKRNISRKLSIPEEKIRVIHHGVANNFKPLNDKESIKKELNEKYGIDFPFPFILHVSAYQPKKNVENIIKAFAICKGKYGIKEKLVIGGKQPERLKMLVKNLRLEKEVIFTGYINKNDLPLFYNIAEAFIFPSFHESFGMPIIEAMACGCPVITSNIFSMPEVAGDAAVLVNPYSVDEIANAMYAVLTNDRLRAKLRKKGLERAKQFSWRKCAEEHLKVYRMVSEE